METIIRAPHPWLLSIALYSAVAMAISGAVARIVMLDSHQAFAYVKGWEEG